MCCLKKFVSTEDKEETDSHIVQEEGVLVKKNSDENKTIQTKSLMKQMIKDFHQLYVEKYEPMKFSKYMYEYQKKSVSEFEFVNNIHYYLTEMSNNDLILVLKKIS